MITQKDRIYNYLRDNPVWFKSYELQAIARSFEASPATVDRRLRDLFKEGSIDRRRVGRYEEYRIKSHSMTTDQANAFLQSLNMEKPKVQEALL